MKQPIYIFGTRAIIETILAGKTIDKVFIDQTARSKLHKELRLLIQQRAIPHSYVPTVKLNNLTKQNHQGAVAYLAPIVFASLHHVVQTSYERGKSPLIILLDGVTDVRNFGAIVRTAACANADAIVIPSRGSAPVSGEAMKTSAGALAHLPICRVARLSAAIDELKMSGLQIIACHERAPQSLYHANLRLPTALLLGAEDKGIAPQHLKLADTSVHIPTFGPIASLNVSIASAILLYEHIRQRQG